MAASSATNAHLSIRFTCLIDVSLQPSFAVDIDPGNRSSQAHAAAHRGSRWTAHRGARYTLEGARAGTVSRSRTPVLSPKLSTGTPALFTRLTCRLDSGVPIGAA